MSLARMAAPALTTPYERRRPEQTDGQLIKSGRFYFHDKYYENGQWKEKEARFCKWADSVMRSVKKLLTKDMTVDAYIGEDASTAIKAGLVQRV